MIHYYGIVHRDGEYIEVLATKEPGKASTDVETGVVYADFRTGERAILAKNIEIGLSRAGAAR